jgi:hypothetical protein
MYSTYDSYIQNGGKLDEATYIVLSKQASAEIDYRTFNRASRHKSKMKDNLLACECALIDVLNSFSSLPAGVTSASNDGVSVSYSQNVKTEEKAKKEEIFNRYLTYPINLLYGGVMDCDFK